MSNVHREEEKILRCLFAVLVDNEAGVLARVIGLFSARGYNIESLNVAMVDAHNNLSRITIVTRGNARVIEQIRKQLICLVPVRSVKELHSLPVEVLEREMALVKFAIQGDQRVEALRVADVFKAKIVDMGQRSCVFEITGAPSKIDAFLLLLGHMELIDLARSGVAAIGRGATALHEE